ncbi:uncharacterized protein BDZ99DRAFT_564875 [Mytilinidion resinicola]|uniref:Uncharacterized protein n=1 Tax=Mytilinidion resinicola TaxID=574789 RepID=A0A6A6Z7J7_9PEZI|nr:uncharacterized protein BDZ99DRAFT_564875 [Mytilinidion resinicola]KAF2817071.1 hypothetical protein BDZ99DRAFT_564875 [Mytilinidion resinicola]
MLVSYSENLEQFQGGADIPASLTTGSLAATSTCVQISASRKLTLPATTNPASFVFPLSEDYTFFAPVLPYLDTLSTVVEQFDGEHVTDCTSMTNIQAITSELELTATAFTETTAEADVLGTVTVPSNSPSGSSTPPGSTQPSQTPGVTSQPLQTPAVPQPPATPGSKTVPSDTQSAPSVTPSLPELSPPQITAAPGIVKYSMTAPNGAPIVITSTMQGIPPSVVTYSTTAPNGEPIVIMSVIPEAPPSTVIYSTNVPNGEPTIITSIIPAIPPSVETYSTIAPNWILTVITSTILPETAPLFVVTISATASNGSPVLITSIVSPTALVTLSTTGPNGAPTVITEVYTGSQATGQLRNRGRRMPRDGGLWHGLLASWD